jgi:hypothetical protein
LSSSKKSEFEVMRLTALHFGMFAAVLLTCGAAFAFPDWPPHHYDPAPAPAPLLAAGIPAFVALGGGVAVTKIVRRFRRSK